MTNTENWIAAQVAVIGSVLIAPERWAGEVIFKTEPEHYSDTYRPYFLAIRAMFSAGDPIDPVTVRKNLGIEDGAQLMHIMQETPTAENCGAYIDLLLETSRLQRIRELGAKLQEASSNDEADSILEQINRLNVGKSHLRIVTMEQANREFVERQRAGRPDYLTWDIQALDQKTYCESGDFVVIGGYPSDGKTTLALKFAYHQAREKRVGFFSFETKDQKLFDRLIPMVTKINFGKVKDHSLSDEDWETWGQCTPDINANHLELIQASSMSVNDIKAVALARRYEVIYVDYLQLVSPERRDRSLFEQVSQISMSLHTLAQDAKITVVALSQLTRPDKTFDKATKKYTIRAPIMSDLRQSGQIEQDADLILFIYRTDYFSRASKRELKVAKNKEGEAYAVIKMDFDGSTQTFAADRHWEADYKAMLAEDKKRKQEQRRMEREAASSEPPQMSLLPDDEDNPFLED